MPYAAGLATALLLSGCGGSVPPTEPVTAPPLAQSDSTTVASSGTPTSSATTAVEDPFLARIPKAARPNTQAGAEAFAKFYYEQVAKAWMKPDPALLDSLQNDGCKTCSAFRSTAEYLRKRGQRYASSPLTIKGTSVYAFIEGKKHIAVTVLANEAKIIDRKGRSVETVAAEGTQVFVLSLAFEGHWVAIRSQVEASS